MKIEQWDIVRFRIQANDRDQWCPGAREGEVIDTRKNPVIWHA